MQQAIVEINRSRMTNILMIITCNAQGYIAWVQFAKQKTAHIGNV